MKKIMISVDAGDYRASRRQELEALALRLAGEVKNSGRSRTVPALNPAERRIIHMAIQDDRAIRSRSVGEGIFKKIIDASGEMFYLSLKIGAPAVAALLLTTAAFGIIARVVPQMNILIVAFPLKIVVGLFFFGFSIEILLYSTRHFLSGFEGVLGVLMKLVKV